MMLPPAVGNTDLIFKQSSAGFEYKAFLLLHWLFFKGKRSQSSPQFIHDGRKGDRWIHAFSKNIKANTCCQFYFLLQ